MSALFVAQWCHVHFSGGGVVVIESTRSTLNNFFKADLLANTTHLHDGVILLLRPESVSFKDGSG